MASAETPPDITKLGAFLRFAILMIVFGAMIGIGVYVTFSNLHIGLQDGLAIFVILIVTSTVIAFIPRLYRDYVMKWGMFADDDDNEYEDEEWIP